MNMILAIAAGGAIGSVLRHYAGQATMLLLGMTFPYGTLFVNIAGSFVMGVLVSLFALQGNASPELRAFLTVGLLGGFTTFSSFSLDAAALYERGEPASAALYVALSLVLSLSAIFAGLFLGRSFAA
ncbi:MAG: fluoride efflux transporter CrcB [Micavibrio aeruginosavorus]|uniref:Fluoride-specific ion channel FluC n=1 Tax=Micavibrio aeruginosavorus TaxID=349221 RepID=A0A2W5MPR9_9BACT|nr:MAG: fluoride efflux transporter CrcB [Micavibrio aeruginosavorus]